MLKSIERVVEGARRRGRKESLLLKIPILVSDPVDVSRARFECSRRQLDVGPRS